MEAEIARLRGEGATEATSADNMLLKQMLDDVQRAKDKLEHDYLQSHTEKLILESQLASLRGGGPLDEGYEKLSSITVNSMIQLTLDGLKGPMCFSNYDTISWIKSRSLRILRGNYQRPQPSSRPLRENSLLLNQIVGQDLCLLPCCSYFMN